MRSWKKKSLYSKIWIYFLGFIPQEHDSIHNSNLCSVSVRKKAYQHIKEICKELFRVGLMQEVAICVCMSCQTQW